MSNDIDMDEIGAYWKDAPEWAVALGLSPCGDLMWLGDKGYAYIVNQNTVFRYGKGLTGGFENLSKDSFQIIITREDAMKDAKVGQVEYPIYKKSKDSGIVVKFTAPGEGEIVVEDGRWKVGDIHTGWVHHTDTRIWEDWTPQEGVKHDNGKPEFRLIPQQALEDVAKVMSYGAKKYAPDNWRRVPNGHDRYIDAALRHINAHLRGEQLDEESGETHLAHAVCSLMMAMESK